MDQELLNTSAQIPHQAMPVPHLSPDGTVMMGGASVMRYFGQAMMYAFASGAGSERRGGARGFTFCFFVAKSRTTREFEYQDVFF